MSLSTPDTIHCKIWTLKAQRRTAYTSHLSSVRKAIINLTSTISKLLHLSVWTKKVEIKKADECLSMGDSKSKLSEEKTLHWGEKYGMIEQRIEDGGSKVSEEIQDVGGVVQVLKKNWEFTKEGGEAGEW